jgi:Flp pilus assembly protein TadD
MRSGGTQRGGRLGARAFVAAYVIGGAFGSAVVLGCAGRSLRTAPTPAPALVTATAQPAPIAVPRASPAANGAVVTVLSGGGRAVGVGSGFLVAADRVVTALHVVDGESTVRVRFADRRETAVLGVVAEDRAHDLVVLAIVPSTSTPVLSVSPEPVTTGMSLAVVSSLRGRAQTAGRVVVTRGELPRKRLGRAFRARGAIGPGSSGCPLLDDAGLVRGVVAEEDLSAEDTGLVVPGRFVQALAMGPIEPMAAFGARTARNPDLLLRRDYEQALHRLRTGDREGARRDAERIYAEGRGRDSLYAWNAVAVVRDALALAGRSEEAVFRLRQMAAENPARSEPGMTLGGLLWDLGRKEEAVAAYREAMQREPGDAAPHAALASKLWLTGRGAEAESEARVALAHDPESVPALEVLENARVARRAASGAVPLAPPPPAPARPPPVPPVVAPAPVLPPPAARRVG